MEVRKIGEIKEELKATTETELQQFIQKYSTDERAGVKTVVFVERRESFKSILSYLDYFLKKMNIGYKKNNLFVGSSEKMEKHYEDDIFRIFNFDVYRIL